MSKKHWISLLIVVVVLILDQTLKFWVKTNMFYGEEFKILGLEWARIHFVENPGMAFGLEMGGMWGKLGLSVFRIIAVTILIIYINKLIKFKVSTGLVVSFSFILAGAIGNILDSAFYGLMFSESAIHGQVSEFMPADGGYAGFLFGKVVDMFYFPLIDGYFPDWFPFWGGEHFMFFRPVFNVADSAITTGVLSIILFHRKFFTANEDFELSSKSESVNESSSEIEDGEGN